VNARSLGCVVLGLASLVGCGGPDPNAIPIWRHIWSRTAREDPNIVRKRECVATLTAGQPTHLHTLMRSLCAEAVEGKVPGLAVAIAEPGQPTIHAEFGDRCFGEDPLVASSTVFRIGSVSKTVTAALALGSVATSELALEQDPSLVPNFTTQAGIPSPKLDALLRHRSGLGEIVPDHLVELDGAWLPALARSPAAGSPGAWHYSNTGYSLIGAMLEQASGTSYAELVATRIATPLGFTRFTVDTNIDDAACGHLREDPDMHPLSIRDDLGFMPGDPRWMNPAGGVLSSATELAEFALALGTDAVPGTAAMLIPGEPLSAADSSPNHHDERYGLGLRSWRLDAETLAFGHTGNNGSFLAQLWLVPDRRAIVILANSGDDLPASFAAAEALLGVP
jgi:CubicO group peptidase (beta-lactamase class C family)